MSKASQLGETIRDRRLALGYSLGQLATKVNKTASSIRAWEKGEQLPSEEESAALAAALDLDAANLLSLRPDPDVWVEDAAKPVDVHDPWPENKGQSAPDDGDDVGDADANSDNTDADKADADESGADAGPVDMARAPASADDEPADDQPDDEPADEEPAEEELADQNESAEPADTEAGANAAVAAVARPEPPWPAPARSAVHDPPVEPAPAPVAPAVSPVHDTPTEAVPVVPPGRVAVLEDRDPALAAAPAEPVRGNGNPLLTVWDQAVQIYHDIFDPRRRWIYRVRFVLLLIAFYVMLRVLAWAGGNLLDALGEVLDSFSFSPSETPDVAN